MCLCRFVSERETEREREIRRKIWSPQVPLSLRGQGAVSMVPSSVHFGVGKASEERSAIYIKAIFVAAQILGWYPGEQRVGPALISEKKFKDTVWRWVFAGKNEDLSPTLQSILDSIYHAAGPEGTKRIQDLSLRIRGRMCALVRLEIAAPTVLEEKGIFIVQGSNFYLIMEIHQLPQPFTVTFLKDHKGDTRRVTRVVSFGTHVDSSVLDLLKSQGELIVRKLLGS